MKKVQNIKEILTLNHKKSRSNVDFYTQSNLISKKKCYLWFENNTIIL